MSENRLPYGPNAGPVDVAALEATLLHAADQNRPYQSVVLSFGECAWLLAALRSRQHAKSREAGSGSDIVLEDMRAPVPGQTIRQRNRRLQ